MAIIQLTAMLGRHWVPMGWSAMAKTIRCECGYVARGDSSDDVIEAIRKHMASDHPTLLDTVSREDLLGWIQLE